MKVALCRLLLPIALLGAAGWASGQQPAKDVPERSPDAHEPPPEGDHADVVVTHVSLYDGTVEGLQVDGRPVWSMQFHPEASPGPHDARDALVRFVEIAAEHARSRA